LSLVQQGSTAKIIIFFILITISNYEIQKKVDNAKEDENDKKKKKCRKNKEIVQ